MWLFIGHECRPTNGSASEAAASDRDGATVPLGRGSQLNAGERKMKGEHMRKTFLAAVLAITALLGSTAIAGNPHFVFVDLSTSGNTVTATGKEAGLGDEPQVHIVLTATAECINPGGNHPQAANKTSVSAEGDFPVQNGKAEFTLTATATFQPACSPPMTVSFSNITVTDTTSGITYP